MMIYMCIYDGELCVYIIYDGELYVYIIYDGELYVYILYYIPPVEIVSEAALRSDHPNRLLCRTRKM